MTNNDTNILAQHDVILDLSAVNTVFHTKRVEKLFKIAAKRDTRQITVIRLEIIILTKIPIILFSNS